MAWSNTHAISLAQGSSQYLSRSNDAYDITAGTIQAWIKTSSLPSITGHSYGIITTANNTALQGFYLVIGSSDDKVAAAFGAGANEVKSTVAISNSTYTHVAFAWDTNGKDLIINGVSVSTSGVAATLTAGNANLYIGADTSGAGRYFDGLIDDVRIYNVKRTATQVASDMQTTLVGNESNLLSYWKLDNALTDSTSGARTLTNNGSATFSTTVGYPGQFSTTDTSGTPVDSQVVNSTLVLTSSDTLGASTEIVRAGYGFSNQSKSTASTVTNQSKS